MPDAPTRQLTIPQGAVWVESWRRRQNKALITLPGGFGGTGTLDWDGVLTGPVLTTSATAAAVQAALEAIPTIGAGEVLVTGAAGGPWLLEWLDRMAGTMQNLPVAAPSTILVEKVYRSLAGYHAALTVRDRFGGTALVTALDTGGGTPAIVIDTATNTILMTVPHTVTHALTPTDFPANGAVYELQVTPPTSDTERWEHGTVRLSQGVV